MKRILLTAAYTAMLLSAAQANQISEDQQQYIKRYKKQANIPKPADMLINTDPEPTLTEGFSDLYNGENLDGWTQKGGAHSFEAQSDMIVGTCVPGEKNAFLCTERTNYSDFIFTVEIKWEVDGNSGVMFRAREREDNGSKRVYGPQCEMEGINNSRKWSSGIYGEAAGGWIYPLWLNAHKEVRQSLKKDGWNRVTIEAKGGTVKTWLNGYPSAYWKTTEYKQGFFGLQVHQGKNGIILFRNIKIKELNAKPKPVPAYTDTASARQAVAEFKLVGEYLAKSGDTALQTNLLKDGDFLVATYQGGLPGDGWDQSPIKSEKLSPKALKDVLSGYVKTDRSSPTQGKPAPKDALLRFPDDFTNVEDGIMKAGGKTKKDLKSFHMHLEFMQPFKPGRNPSSQDRGNSGIYIFNNYEIQVIDSFALDLKAENNAIETESLNSQWCGALYKQKVPDVHMAYPPLRWQTYDIDFQAPEFDGKTKVKNARLTVRHNGVLIHDDVELKSGTGAGAKRPQLSTGPVIFQDHANPIIYRNVWATEL